MKTSLTAYEHEARMRLLRGEPTITVDANDLLEILNRVGDVGPTEPKPNHEPENTPPKSPAD